MTNLEIAAQTLDQRWAPPTILDLADQSHRDQLSALTKAGKVRWIHDPLDLIAADLHGMLFPDKTGPGEHLDDFCAELRSQGDAFGNWVYFPWSGGLCRFPPRDLYRRLRTFRNQDLIRDTEQIELLEATVVVLGLSVGSAAVHALVDIGIGGRFVLVDSDHLDSTNVNRVAVGYPAVGMMKADLAAIYISEKDPWTDIAIVRDDFTEANVSLLESADLIVEEVDSMSAKALARLEAARLRTPLISAGDLADKYAVDVERHDLPSSKTQPFGGRIARSDVERVAREGLPPAENQRLMIKYVGGRNISTRLVASALAIGSRLGGIPQLATTSRVGGAAIAFAAREILLGRPLESGRYLGSFRKLFRLQRRESSLREGILVRAQLVKQSRRS